MLSSSLLIGDKTYGASVSLVLLGWGCFNTFVCLLTARINLTLGFVRDHLRYVDDIVCAAARVLEAVREHARKNTKHKPSMDQGIFDAMHVRLELYFLVMLLHVN